MNLPLNKQLPGPLAFHAVIIVLVALAVSGCHLGQPASTSFASVVIQGRSLAEIQAAAGQVFREDGYMGSATGPTSMLFQKEGSRANSLAYNGLVDAYEGAQTLVRVRAELIELGGGACRLQCQAYMVRHAGDSFFEEENRLSNLRSGPYQRLLDKVASRLKQP